MSGRSSYAAYPTKSSSFANLQNMNITQIGEKFEGKYTVIYHFEMYHFVTLVLQYLL